MRTDFGELTTVLTRFPASDLLLYPHAAVSGQLVSQVVDKGGFRNSNAHRDDSWIFSFWISLLSGTIEMQMLFATFQPRLGYCWTGSRECLEIIRAYIHGITSKTGTKQ